MSEVGLLTCSCVIGFALEDITECDANDACSANQDCANTNESFTCSCVVVYAA